MQNAFKPGFLAKTVITASAVVVLLLPAAFGRQGLKLYSVGTNPVWNSPASWSFSANGPEAGQLPQGNDTLIVDRTLVLNINFTFLGQGALELTSQGLLRGSNLDLSFIENSNLTCKGEIEIKNLDFADNSYLQLENSGRITVSDSWTVNSSIPLNISGSISVEGLTYIGSASSVSGNGIIQSYQYNGSGPVFRISSASLIPGGSMVTEFNWTGSLDSSWNNTANWTGGSMPGENSNIAILASAHDPIVTTAANSNNISINPGASLTLMPSAVMTVKGNLSIPGNARLVLKNSVSEHSSLLLNGSMSGKIQVEYPVLADQKCLVSTPVGLAESGTFINMYLRSYDEPASQWGEYIVPTHDPLKVMQGYELYSLFSETRIFEGTPDHAPKSFTISNEGNGLNLAGNPYPCFIDWENNTGEAWQRNAIASAIYYPDPTGSGNYSVYLPGGDDAVSLNNGSRYIAPMQGFFVKAGKAGSLTVTEKSRVNGLDDTRLVLKNDAIKFKLNDSEGLSDESMFRVISNSTPGFDDAFDAIKIQSNSGAPSLYLSAGDEVKYAVSSVPSVNSSLEIPLNILCSKKGMFILTAAGCNRFENQVPLNLEDKETGKYIDLRADSIYSFYQSPEMNPARFVLHFKTTEGTPDQGVAETNVSVMPGEIRITGSANKPIVAKLYSIDGKLINSAAGLLPEGISLENRSRPFEICILQILNGTQTITKKILTK